MTQQTVRKYWYTALTIVLLVVVLWATLASRAGADSVPELRPTSTPPVLSITPDPWDYPTATPYAYPEPTAMLPESGRLPFIAAYPAPGRESYP